jgi:hypothetical protein
MRRYLVLMTFVILLGYQSVIPVRSDDLKLSSSHTSSQIRDPDYMLLGEIKIKAPIKAQEEGVIVEVRVMSMSDPAVSAIIRYPGSGSVLHLRNDNTQVLSPPVQIPNKRLVEVRVHVLAVPKEITAEGLNIVYFAFDKIVQATTHATLRRV